MVANHSIMATNHFIMLGNHINRVTDVSIRVTDPFIRVANHPIRVEDYSVMVGVHSITVINHSIMTANHIVRVANHNEMSPTPVDGCRGHSAISYLRSGKCQALDVSVEEVPLGSKFVKTISNKTDFRIRLHIIEIILLYLSQTIAIRFWCVL